jgi:hypothetical protein
MALFGSYYDRKYEDVYSLMALSMGFLQGISKNI